MNSINKIYSLLFLVLLAAEIFSQEQFYISNNGTIKSLLTGRSTYNVLNIIPIQNNNSTKVLDSLICIFLNGSRMKLEYYYNNDLSLNYFIIANWFNDEWINTEKHTYTYNPKGNIESILWELYNPSLKEWVKDAKDIFSYDSSGNKITYLHQIYNGQEFINGFKYEYFYDTASNLVLSVSQDWIDSKWVNTTRTIYTYTPEKVKDTVLFQIWSNEQWINHSMNI